MPVEAIEPGEVEPSRYAVRRCACSTAWVAAVAPARLKARDALEAATVAATGAELAGARIADALLELAIVDAVRPARADVLAVLANAISTNWTRCRWDEDSVYDMDDSV